MAIIPPELMNGILPEMDQAVLDPKKGLLPKRRYRFFVDYEEDKGLTARLGTPQMREVEFVEIGFPGTKETVKKPIKELTREQAFESQEAYRAWKQGLEAPINGTPLEEIPFLRTPQVKTLTYLGFRTAQEVTEAPQDRIAQYGPGAFELQRKLKNWLEAAAETAKTTSLIDELEKRDSKIEYLQKQLDEVAKRFCEVTGQEFTPAPKEATKPLIVKKRGRPKKEKTNGL